jgi:hypothetical protein
MGAAVNFNSMTLGVQTMISVFGSGLATLAVIVSHLIYNRHLRDIEIGVDRRFDELNRHFGQSARF